MIYLTVIAGLEALVIAGLVVALLLDRKGCAELVANLDERHAQQVNRLVAAIQRPDIVQPSQPTKRLSPEEYDRMRQQARNNQLVGTVQHARPE